MRSFEEGDREKVEASLNEKGFATIGSALSDEECRALTELYTDSGSFRSTINMERYRFGKGEYKYFAYPLPEIVQALREMYYPLLAPIANEWMRVLGEEMRYPATLEEFLAECRAAGQDRPTPLLLHYGQGCYNTLHQDIYGNLFFPFQVVFMLSQQGTAYAGGELVFVEQLPRAQSGARVVTANRGDAIVFTTNFRPVKGSKGYYRAKMKHGVSAITHGERYTMGIIFHDAS